MTNAFQIEVINETGERENLEDFIIYKTSSESSNIFIVCDGVGGLEKGEIASKLACESMISYFEDKINKLPNQDIIQNAVDHTISNFNKYVNENSESKEMATTAALLFVNGSAAVAAHIGDSRIYHVRNGKILFKTIDHSYVNDLVKSGFITEKEAVNHPKRNQITRVIQDSSDDAIADVEFINNIEIDDYFMLCTDGILEAIDDKFIQEHFTIVYDLKDIIDLIKNTCKQESTDNYSGIFIKVINL